MLRATVYPIVWIILWSAFLLFALLLITRLLLSYADPNPFGFIGRLGFKIRRSTEKWVYPAARFLANFRVDTRLAPLLTLLIGLVITYFVSGIFSDLFFIVDGLSAGISTGRPKVFIGFVLYGLLSLLILFIFIRFLSQWFVTTRRTFLAFVMRVTDPIVLPVQRLIPPIGMFDISAMILLILLGLLQSVVINVFVRS